MKPHQTAHSQWSILVSHTSAASTAAGLLCLAAFSSGLHIFAPPAAEEFCQSPVQYKPCFPAPNLPLFLLQCSGNICHHYWSRVAVLGLALHVDLVQAWIAWTAQLWEQSGPSFLFQVQKDVCISPQAEVRVLREAVVIHTATRHESPPDCSQPVLLPAVHRTKPSVRLSPALQLF